MDSRRQACPAPPPSSPGTSVRLLGRASPLFRLPGLAFPRGGGGGAAGEVRRESFRCQQPPTITATARGAPGRGEGSGLLASLPSRGAARAEKRGVQSRPSLGAEKLKAFAKTRGLGLTDCGRPEAVPSPVEPPGKKAGAQQDGWVWIVVLFFLFVAFLGTKKKAQPFTPLHLHLSRPEIQPQWLGRTETTVCLSPYNSVWVGRAFLLGPTPGF